MNAPFFDTGVALNLVVEEPRSNAVREFLKKRRCPVWISRLIELDIENALHALCYRNQIDRDQLAGAQDFVAELFRAGRFRRVDLSHDKVAAETLSLVPLVTGKTGCRTLDLMHVATARLLSAKEFVSTDKRQVATAKFCGLRVVDLDGVM